MSSAGIREARQNLSALLAEVAKGRTVVITDRGRPVARLVPASRCASRPFPGRERFRKSMPAGVALSRAVLEGRDERE